jgi:NADH-quinone oxidoreductase subunit J
MMETVVFVIAAIGCLAGAVGVVVSRNPIYAALSLVGTLFSIAVLFVAQDANFLAAVQVIVYAGAIVVLFLFVIMLLGVDRADDLEIEPLVGQRIAAVVLGVGVFALPVLALASADFQPTGLRSASGSISGAVNDLEALGESVFTDYLYAFEITSILLVISVVGAVVLVRRSPRADEVIDDGQLEDEQRLQRRLAGERDVADEEPAEVTT